jgi:hypothetical protein
MGARPEMAQHFDDVVDVIVQIEPAFRDRHHARVLPIGDEHLVFRQHGFHGSAQQRGVMAG